MYLLEIFFFIFYVAKRKYFFREHKANANMKLFLSRQFLLITNSFKANEAGRSLIYNSKCRLIYCNFERKKRRKRRWY